MKLSTFIICGVLLFPFLASAAGGGAFWITSLTDGFVITENQDTIPVGITTNKGFWENTILKNGGKITAFVSSSAGTVSQQILWLAPVVPHNQGGSITAYGGGVVLDATPLRGRTALPLVVRVEAENKQGKVIASAEVAGTILPAHHFALALSAITPPSAYYERGSAWMNFTAIVFAAGPYDNIEVQQITLTRSGGTDTDLQNIQLFDGSTRLGTASRFLDGKAVVTLDLPFVIPANARKILMVKADVDSNATLCRIQDGISFGIANAPDVRALNVETGDILAPGNFTPIFGNLMGIE